jgi:uncharacterized protein VirK/YbjX
MEGRDSLLPTVKANLAAIPPLSPTSRGWRLLTLVKHLPDYARYYLKLRRSAYGRAIPKGDPFFERKFVTPYLANFLTPQQRLTIQSHLCEFVDRTFCPQNAVPQLREGLLLWRKACDGDVVTMVLGLPKRTMLEGDLTLELLVNATLIYRLSFSFVPGHVLGMDDRHVLLIGGSQGVHGTADHSRRIARQNSEIPPSGLLLTGLRAIAEALDITTLGGVAAASQSVVHAAPDLHRNAYDDLWTMHHGTLQNGIYLMPVRPADDAVIEGSHRARTRRKRRYRQGLQAEFVSLFSRYLTGSDAIAAAPAE